MFENREVVSGVVIDCTENNQMLVRLDNGGTGIVASGEEGRRVWKTQPDYHGMIGCRKNFFAGEMDAQGRCILSAKAYEDHMFDLISQAFFRKERNVYCGRLVSVTQDGNLAYYALAQGVNAAVALRDFAYCRVDSFNDIDLPRKMPVAIREIDGSGRICLYGKAAFPDFAGSVEKLGLAEGCEIEGLVNGFVPGNGDSIVMLAPNLTALADPAALHSRVRIRVKHILPDVRRLKAETVSVTPATPDRSFFCRWCRQADELPAYLDVAAFEASIRPSRRTDGIGTPPAPQEAEISYEVTAADSPFVLHEGEKALRVPISGGSSSAIVFEYQRGLLTEDHKKLAKSVNALKYATAFQLQRHLDCAYGLRLSERAVNTLIDRLLKHDIIQCVHLCLGEDLAALKVYYPGASNYANYAGERRSLPDRAYIADPDVVQIKCSLSANQLLLGMLHSWQNIRSCEYNCLLTMENNQRIRPRFRLTLEDGTVLFAESLRGAAMDWMLEKLKRYDSYFGWKKETSAKVILTVETREIAETMAKRVEALRLKYDVLLTSDLECLPSPVLRTVAAHRAENREKMMDKITAFFTAWRAS